MILNPCSLDGADPYWADSIKSWRCSWCNRAGYPGDKEGKGWNAMNNRKASGVLSKMPLPNRQESPVQSSEHSNITNT